MIVADEEVALEVASGHNESPQSKTLVAGVIRGLPLPSPNSERSMRDESIGGF